MNVLNYRVDDRLVHGCVATMWVPQLNVERVICIDDESANNQMLKNAMRLATPNNVFLSVLTHEKAIENLKVDRYQNQRVMVVAKNPKTFLQLVENGIPVKEVTLGNLGNIDKSESSVAITRYITVNDEDYETICKLHDLGVKLDVRLQPGDPLVDNFYEQMQSKKGK